MTIELSGWDRSRFVQRPKLGIPRPTPSRVEVEGVEPSGRRMKSPAQRLPPPEERPRQSRRKVKRGFSAFHPLLVGDAISLPGQLPAVLDRPTL